MRKKKRLGKKGEKEGGKEIKRREKRRRDAICIGEEARSENR